MEGYRPLGRTLRENLQDAKAAVTLRLAAKDESRRTENRERLYFSSPT